MNDHFRNFKGEMVPLKGKAPHFVIQKSEIPPTNTDTQAQMDELRTMLAGFHRAQSNHPPQCSDSPAPFHPARKRDRSFSAQRGFSNQTPQADNAATPHRTAGELTLAKDRNLCSRCLRFNHPGICRNPLSAARRVSLTCVALRVGCGVEIVAR